MSTISSRQRKRHGHVDPMFVLVFLVMILALLVFAPFSDNTNDSFLDALRSFGNAPSSLSLKSEPSFVSDQRYWAANCIHGWSSNLVCDAIESRTQSCSISVESAYCTEYDQYLKQFRN